MSPNGFKYEKYVILPAVIIASVLLIIIGILSFSNMALLGGDLTNTLTIAVEIGIGVFISIILFFYSKFQQGKAEDLLSDVKNINKNLEQQRKTMKDTYVRTIINCLKEIWGKTTLIMMNLDLQKLPEDTESVPIRGVNDIIQTNKIQLLLFLDQLNTLAVLSSSVLDSEMISSILELKQQLHDNVIQKGMFRASQPWSSAIMTIDIFVKTYFPNYIQEFKTDIVEKLLPAEIRDSIKQGRSLSSA